MSNNKEIVETEDVNGKQEQGVIMASSGAPPHADAEAMVRTRGQAPTSRRAAGIACAVALVAAIVWGLHVRAASEASVVHATQAAAILSVNVVHPVEGSKADDLALPGSVQAFTDTPIYSRTNGYLKKWYFALSNCALPNWTRALARTQL
jgi:hypothetical protein